MIYDFATGNTNPENFPADELAAAAADVIPKIVVELNRYPGKFGHLGLRKLMAQREFDREGVTLDPDQIILTHVDIDLVGIA